MQRNGVLFVSVDYRNIPQVVHRHEQHLFYRTACALAPLNGSGSGSGSTLVAQVKVDGMLADVGEAVCWVIHHCTEYGGDPDNISLIGQSAGAHLSAAVALNQAVAEVLQEAEEAEGVEGHPEGHAEGAEYVEPPEPLLWSVSSLRRWVGISGPYDLITITSRLHERGLHRRVFGNLMGGAEGGEHTPLWAQRAKKRYSPTQMVRRTSFTIDL
jgi:hypothetical protein